MFFCDGCAKKNGWPQSLSISYGRCEVCRELAACYEVASRYLPEDNPPAPVSDAE